MRCLRRRRFSASSTWVRARAAFGTSEVPGWDTALDDGLLDLSRASRADDGRCQLGAAQHPGDRKLGYGPAEAGGDLGPLCEQAAALALLQHSELGAEDVARQALGIAADICIYTNDNIIIEKLDIE